MDTTDWRASPDTIAAIVGGRHGDPFAVLGLMPFRKGWWSGPLFPAPPQSRCWRTTQARRSPWSAAMMRASSKGCFPRLREPFAYKLHVNLGRRQLGPARPIRLRTGARAVDDYLLVEGTHRQLYERLGAHLMLHEGVDGVHFAVWAPHASRVSVVGDFNRLGRPPPPDAQAHRHRRVGDLRPGHRRREPSTNTRSSGRNGVRAAAEGRSLRLPSELRPSTASVVARPTTSRWARRRLHA